MSSALTTGGEIFLIRNLEINRVGVSSHILQLISWFVRKLGVFTLPRGKKKKPQVFQITVIVSEERKAGP